MTSKDNFKFEKEYNPPPKPKRNKLQRAMDNFDAKLSLAIIKEGLRSTKAKIIRIEKSFLKLELFLKGGNE